MPPECRLLAFKLPLSGPPRRPPRPRRYPPGRACDWPSGGEARGGRRAGRGRRREEHRSSSPPGSAAPAARTRKGREKAEPGGGEAGCIALCLRRTWPSLALRPSRSWRSLLTLSLSRRGPAVHGTTRPFWPERRIAMQGGAGRGTRRGAGRATGRMGEEERRGVCENKGVEEVRMHAEEGREREDFRLSGASPLSSRHSLTHTRGQPDCPAGTDPLLHSYPVFSPVDQRIQIWVWLCRAGRGWAARLEAASG